MVPQRVLVVDGDWKIRKLIRSNLEAHGLEVAEAGDGHGCLRALQAASYDLVLLNPELPDANGWNVIQHLRREVIGPQVPIVVLAAEPINSRLLRRFQRVGQLLKPFSARALLQCVDRTLALDGAGPC